MKPLAVTLLCFVPGIAMPGFSQTGRVPAHNHPKQIDCVAVHAASSCRSFNALLEAGSFGTLLTQPASTTFVCFRRQEDAFLMLHFDLPLQWDVAYDQPEQRPQRNGKDVDMMKAEGNLTLVEYKQKTRGRSFNVELTWWKAEPDPDRDATASASGNLRSAPSASVTSKEILLSLAHMNNGAPTVDYSLQIQVPARRFVERNKIQETGSCVEFTQPPPR